MKLAVLVLVVACAEAALAQGLLIPAERDLPPLALRSHSVSIEVDRVGAVTRVEQVFENNTDRDLEATYVFPVPAGAVMSSFALFANGVERKGKLLDRHIAKHLYGLGVTAGQAPGRLYEGADGAFTAVIHPVPAHGVQTLKLTFSQVLPRDAGLVWYEYPVPAGASSSGSPTFQMHVEGTIRGPLPIKAVYSPSHPLTVDRPGPREARFRMDGSAPLDRTLRIGYSISDRDVGIDLVTHRGDPGEPGYFMLLVSPGDARTAARRVSRDVLFVLDRSGSMAGEKMEQAKRALKYCVNNLQDTDRFDVITFSTDVETWKGSFADAKADRAGALAHIDALQADGGTNVDGALARALAYPRAADRPAVVVFMTDGKPTLGDTTDAGEILKRVEKLQSAGPARARIFTWGLGYDLDAQLLDRLAEENGGVSEYVAPGEDLALKVESFHRKSAHPVLSDLALDVKGVTLAGVYPRRLPELYAGGVLVVLGRYSGSGAAEVHLTGTMNGASESFVAPVAFEAASARSFVADLWARRHIGHLLTAIRQVGQRQDLIDKVVRLSEKHGVQTPYTSWLVKDAGVVVASLPAAAAPVLASTAPAPAFASEGEAAVEASRCLGALKRAERLDDAGPAVAAAGTRFVRRGEVWCDERYDASCAVTDLPADGEAARRLIARHPELAGLCARGRPVILVTGLRRAVRIC